MKSINPTIKAGCGVISILGTGFVAGAVSLFVFIVINVQKSENWNTRESKNFLGNHFAKKLNLTEEQREKFQPIVDEILERRWKTRRDYIEGDISMIEDEFLPRLKEFLTPDQQVKARKMIDKWRQEDAAKLKKAGPEAEPETENR